MEQHLQFIKLGGMPLPPFIPVLGGWIESDHKKITDTKDQLTIFNNTDEWELRKRLANPYELIYSADDSFPCLAKVSALSRSYFKMTEMLNLLDFWKDKKATDFGLMYEAYDKSPEFDLFNHSFYISDSEWTRWKCYSQGKLVNGDQRSLSEHILEGHKLIYHLIHPETDFDEHFYEE